MLTLGAHNVEEPAPGQTAVIVLLSVVMHGVAHLLFKELRVCGAVSSAQVEGPMRRISELLQLVLPVALLGSLYGPLLLGGPLMGSGGRLTPARSAAVSEACSGEPSILSKTKRATTDLSKCS